jgi:hypothetical protein
VIPNAGLGVELARKVSMTQQVHEIAANSAARVRVHIENFFHLRTVHSCLDGPDPFCDIAAENIE